MNAAANDFNYQTRLSAGKHWSLRVRRGIVLRLTDLQGGANVGMVMYNAQDTLERYNAPDTLKCQHTFHLRQGNCLYSDMGRVLASLIEDSVGGHDTVCGNSDRGFIDERFGRRDYQNDRNDWHQNGHDAFLVELSKYGLEGRDLPANVNWFSKCAVQADGGISLVDGHSAPGSTLALRFDMDALVLLHTCPHPLSLSEHYPAGEVALSLSVGEPVSEDDECLNNCDENRRGFRNNELYHQGVRAFA
ncbi:urea amidolyase associated protein UAAP1 [Granulosicoccus sp. 3-233]|uniref:urea amidolyase associated protein UAAP1 n=1 Tax=Granulosicoccus sp. 3-233 TaxID=3417969 RepID=UPI003D34CEFC